MEESGLTFRGPATSTFFSHSEFGDGRRESILDHAYAAGLDTEISIMSYAATDHRPVVVRASCIKTAASGVKTIMRRNPRGISIPILCDAVSRNIPESLYDMLDVSEINLAITTAITVALDEVAPLKPVSSHLAGLLPNQQFGFRAKRIKHNGRGRHRSWSLGKG